MPAQNKSLCFQCGRDADVGTAINRMPDGSTCLACAERLLDRIPPPFPGFGHMLDRPAVGARAVEQGEMAAVQPKSTRKSKKGQRR